MFAKVDFCKTYNLFTITTYHLFTILPFTVLYTYQLFLTMIRAMLW